MTNRTLIVPALLLSSVAFAKPGLKPVTEAELRHMDSIGIKRIENIKPNKIGLERVNAHRSKKGMSKLTKAAKYGKETVSDPNTDIDSEMGGASLAVGGEDFGGALPSAVDNSTLPSFPTIGNQILGSCAAWSMGYYLHTHNTGLVMGWTNNGTDKSHTCSTKFVYNMINGGVDNGAYFADALAMVEKHGCVPWNKWPEDSDYKAWNTNIDDLTTALSRRSNPAQYITNVDTQTGLDQVKQLLNNGYVLTYGTYITSWTYTTIKADPAQASNPLAGQQVMRYMNGQVDGHGMTIVGYDDNAWVDINNNNVVDAGEKGVLKIANSFGTNWKNKGFVFLAYDALKATSAVAGGPTSGRVAAFMSNRVYHQVPRSANGVAYQPKYLAKFNLNHAKRSQMSVKFGWSASTGTTASSTWTPFYLYNKGGAYAFDGTTTASAKTFLMDISDLPIQASGNKFYMTVADNSAGYPATINSFDVIDAVNSTQSSATIASPISVDGTSKTVNLVFNGTASYNNPPTAAMTASASSGTAPLAITFNGSGSTDSDGTVASYSWNFGDGTSATGSSVSKTFSTAGTYNVTLTVTDDDGANSTTSKTITVTAASTVDTTKPVVALTSPANGAKYAQYSTVPAAATASDDKGVTKVMFYVNGYKKCTDYSAPYTCNFTMLRGTSISVKARAYDANNNYTDSTTNYISN